MRLFVAVWPPPEVVDVVARLERPSVDGVRWTSPSQWHVTLRFLGEVPDESVDAVASWLTASCAPLTRVEARLGAATGRFGRGVLHVPVDGLAPWASAVAGPVAGVGAAAPQGPFVGHLTLARARRTSVASLAGAPVPDGPRTWLATGISLVQSRLRAGGAKYSDVVELRLDHPS
jgi:2'-5' RNA ligase